MSKPMRCENPASRPLSAIPTTPAAGPDRIASLPWNNSAAVRPPEDIMNMRRGLSARFARAAASPLAAGEALRFLAILSLAVASLALRSLATWPTYCRRIGER